MRMGFLTVISHQKIIIKTADAVVNACHQATREAEIERILVPY
jgi:hypothetical protein